MPIDAARPAPVLTWTEELLEILREAASDLGLSLLLIALRKVENGRPGREFGVLSEKAPTYHDQLHIAANSIRHLEKSVPQPRAANGLFTEQFLTDFSHKWAPLRADNDPNDLNIHHAPNLISVHTRLAYTLLNALQHA